MIAPLEIPVFAGVAPLIQRYDGFLLDLWGVLHDGERAYPGVLDCLDRLLAAGKRIGLLSNAPRRIASVAQKLSGLGIGPDRYQFLMTSGEAAREAMIRPPDPWHAALGSRCFHIGPERDHCLFEDVAGKSRVGDPESADFVMNSGPVGYEETLEDYESILQRCADRRLPMICANPDLTVMVGPLTVICAGMLARRYQELGGEVRHHGKPYPSVYARCLERFGLPEPRRILAVGDSLRTDIAGANAAGLDCALVTGGLLLDEVGGAWGELPDPRRLTALAVAARHRPTWAVPCLRW
ncbi:MAG: TIGR01459 family HAD-type hydrolase [Azospirillum sp.]|nr:TIGR01459 family HAD-type hydrolase [Azospirillum sp.]